MENNKQPHSSSVEINDLIEDAVSNALARRNDCLSDMTDEEVKNVAGGVTTVLGVIIKLPITLGLIDPNPSLS
jgi:lactobin A/cerein 7B family class IIb bacteriocin